MSPSAPLIRCHCTRCGTQLNADVATIMTLTMCSECGASAFVLTTPVPPALGVPGMPGESLDIWRSRYAGEFSAPPQVAPPPRLAPQPARRPAPMAHRPRPSRPNMTPNAHRPMNPPPSNSGNGVLVGVLIAGGLGVVLVVAVLAITLSGASPEPQSPELAVAEDRSPAPTPASEYDVHDAAVKQFKADLTDAIRELGKADTALRESKDGISAGAETELALYTEALNEVSADLKQAEEKRKTLTDAEGGAQNNLREKEGELQQLRIGQSPILAYIGVYEDLTKLFVEHDEMLVIIDERKTAVQEARILVIGGENELLDLEIAAETADSPQDRAAAQLALNEVSRKVTERKSALADAQDALFNAQSGLTRKERAIQDLQIEVSDARAELDESDLITIQVLASIKTYEKAMILKGKSIATLKKTQKALDDVLHSTDNPYVRYAACKKAYFIARKDRLAADRTVSALERDYLDNGGGAAAKERIRQAKEVADRAKDEEKGARSLMNDAKDKVRDEEKEEKQLVKEIRSAREAFNVQVELVNTEQELLEQAIAKAEKSAGPEEEQRVQQVETLSAEVDKLKQQHEDALDALDDCTREIAKLIRQRDQVERESRGVARITEFYDEDATLELLSGLLARLDDWSPRESFGFTDGDELVRLAKEFREDLDAGALREVCSFEMREKYATDVAAWESTIRKLQTYCSKLESSGSILSRELMK